MTIQIEDTLRSRLDEELAVEVETSVSSHLMSFLEHPAVQGRIERAIDRNPTDPGRAAIEAIEEILHLKL